MLGDPREAGCLVFVQLGDANTQGLVGGFGWKFEDAVMDALGGRGSRG